MRQTIKVRRVKAQFRLAGLPVLALGLIVVISLGLPSAHAQTPIGSAESCFEAGPDHVPAFTVIPVPPVRPGISAHMPTHSPAVAAATSATLVPAGFTPLRAQPVHLLNSVNKDRWIPALRKSPVLLASGR